MSASAANNPCLITDELFSQCYRNLLLREPDSQGALEWQELIRHGKVPLWTLPDRFRSSEEYRAIRAPLLGEKIGFLHIPKTAGTSFRSWLRGLYYDNEVFEVGRGWNPDTAQAKLVCGHVNLSFLRECACTQLFTILRDPIERLISLYRFGSSAISEWPADDPAKALGFEDWLRCTDERARVHWDGYYAAAVLTEEEHMGQNHEALLSHALQRYREFTVVGIQEELPSFFTRVAGALGIRPPLGSPTHNTADQNASVDPDYPEHPHLSARCRALLIEITKLDQAIYDNIRHEVVVLTSSPEAETAAQAESPDLTGRISALNPLSQVSGVFELSVAVENESDSAWRSDTPDSIKVYCRWFEADWHTVASNPDVFPLPQEGVPAQSSKEMSLTITCPVAEGSYHLLVTLLRGKDMLLATNKSFTPLVLDFDVSGSSSPRDGGWRSQDRPAPRLTQTTQT